MKTNSLLIIILSLFLGLNLFHQGTETVFFGLASSDTAQAQNAPVNVVCCSQL